MLPVGVGSRQITSGDLLQHVAHVEGFQQRQVCRLKTVVLSNFFHKPQPWKCPFVQTYANEEGGKTILAHGIQQVQVLPLPVREGSSPLAVPMHYALIISAMDIERA